MSSSIETNLQTRVGKVDFKIDLSGCRGYYRTNFLEVKLLRISPSFRSANIHTLQELQDASDNGFQSVPFAGINTIIESARRLDAFSEWLAQISERGGKNIVVKANSFTGMTNAERDVRIRAMGIE